MTTREDTTEHVKNYFAFKYLVLSGPDEGYSRNASCALNLISTILFTSIFYCYVTSPMKLRITGTLSLSVQIGKILVKLRR